MTKTTLRIVSAAGAIVAAGAFSLSAVPAFAVSHALTITSFTSENSVTSVGLSDSSVLGDDRGGIALTTQGVLNQGDTGITFLSLDLATHTEDSDLTQDNGDALFTDLGTRTSYFFNWTYSEPDGEDGITTFTSFTNVTADGNAGTTTVELSEDLAYLMFDFAEDSDLSPDYVVLNGNGIVGIWDMASGDLAVIDIATGDVTHVEVNTAQAFRDAGLDLNPQVDGGETSTTFDAWGVLEYDGTNYSYFGPGIAEDAGNEVIARFPLTAAVPASIETFAPELVGEDIWRIVPDCANGRWYTHNEADDEKAYAADVVCDLDVSLAETGFNAAPALGIVAAAISAGGLLVLRRRATR
jgi:hypothetical protein